MGGFLSHNLEELSQYKENGVPYNVYYLLIHDGDIDAINYIHEQNMTSIEDGDFEMKVAINAENLNMVRTLRKIGYKYIPGVFSHAILTQQKDVIEELFNEKCEISSKSLEYCIKNNDFDLMKRIILYGCKIEVEAWIIALKSPRPEFLKYLKQKKNKFNKESWEILMKLEDEKMFKTIYENQRILDPDLPFTLNRAEIIRYLSSI